MPSRGSVLVMTLVFVAMFVVIFSALTGLVTRSYHDAVLQSQDEEAFQIAESGIEYARWRLAHAPADFSTQTKTVSDQFAGQLGSYTLTFTSPLVGSSVVLIKSVGTTSGLTSRSVTVQARYGQLSLARYANITNSDVWYGEDIKGPTHSNGGIRMDGQSNSTMTSAKTTYACQPVHGCSSPSQTKPGIWGAGGQTALWQYPTAVIDYSAITVDLLTMKTSAQASHTYYGASGTYGYEVVFNSTGTYSIYKVTAKTAAVQSYDSDTGWETTSYDVASESLVETKVVPAGGVIYVEDTTWVRGDIRGRITLAVGRFPDTPATNADIIISGNILYGGVKDGTREFGAVAQRNILIPGPSAPDQLEIDGAFIAQKGRFGRHYYQNCCGTQTYTLRTKLTQYGMTASNTVPVTTWVDGNNNVISGYQQGDTSYDPNLLYAAPPYFPTNGGYQLISWEQL